MFVRFKTAVGVLLVGCVVSGCTSSSREKQAAWVPKPSVSWYDVAPNEVHALDNLYRIVIPRPTKGLFPASLAVTRVGRVELEEEDGTPRVVSMVYKDPRNEFLRWNASFDDQMAVSEVFPIDQFDMGGGVAEPVQVVAAFNALDARLGLIYAMNELSPDQTEMIGALYDVPNARPIAYIHATAQSVPPPEKGGSSNAKSDDEVDPWRTDSKALVRQKFEEMLYACVFELIQFDEPEVVDVPEGWKPVAPARPVAWPPRQPIRGR